MSAITFTNYYSWYTSLDMTKCDYFMEQVIMKVKLIINLVLQLVTQYYTKIKITVQDLSISAEQVA